MKRFYQHLVFWLICLSFEAYIEISWINYTYPAVAFWKRYLMGISAELLLFTVKIPMVYASFYIITTYAITEKKNLKAIFLLCVIFAFSAMISHALIIEIIFPHVYHDDKPRSFFSERIINSFIDLVFISGIANAVEQYRQQVILRDKEKNLIKEKLTAELIFLKAQINPHFLFNTLNSIYALARKKSDKTADVILKLATLFRFMLYEAARKNISILDEIAIIENYIELEKIRYDERFSIEFKKDIGNANFQITPLILLPFIENAFKHGASETRFNSYIKIELELKDDGVLIFKVENSKDDGNEITEENIGLKNVRRQLELVYSEYKLNITKERYLFKVDLTITLHSHAQL